MCVWVRARASVMEEYRSTPSSCSPVFSDSRAEHSDINTKQATRLERNSVFTDRLST